MTKTRYKNYMKKFWSKRWYYRTVEQWTDAILQRKFVYNLTGLTSQKANELIFECIEKLILEKKINKAQGESIKSMLRSQDEESVYLGVLTIKSIKPKHFR